MQSYLKQVQFQAGQRPQRAHGVDRELLYLCCFIAFLVRTS
jgi:hypothetical protein